ncbi:unnamed protein product, partial [Nesidiocoris tenuis]
MPSIKCQTPAISIYIPTTFKYIQCQARKFNLLVPIGMLEYQSRNPPEESSQQTLKPTFRIKKFQFILDSHQDGRTVESALFDNSPIMKKVVSLANR